MRILGEFDRAGIKCTVMNMNGKISLKLEKNLLEQIYKFRDSSGVQKYEDAVNFTSEAFISSAEQIFENMAQLRGQHLEKLNSSNSSEAFDYIV